MSRITVATGAVILAASMTFSSGFALPFHDETKPKAVRPRNSDTTYADRIMSRDRNGDGKLSGAEIPPPLSRQLEKLDTNKDRALSREELKDVRAPGSSATDSRTSPPGQAAMQKQILQFALTFDTDGDGGLNAAELKKYAQSLAARRAAGRNRGGNRNQQRATTPSKESNDQPKGLSADDDTDPFGNNGSKP